MYNISTENCKLLVSTTLVVLALNFQWEKDILTFSKVVLERKISSEVDKFGYVWKEKSKNSAKIDNCKIETGRY